MWNGQFPSSGVKAGTLCSVTICTNYCQRHFGGASGILYTLAIILCFHFCKLMAALVSYRMHLMKTCSLIQECFEKCCFRPSSGEVPSQRGGVRQEAAGYWATFHGYSEEPEPLASQQSFPSALLRGRCRAFCGFAASGCRGLNYLCAELYMGIVCQTPCCLPCGTSWCTYCSSCPPVRAELPIENVRGCLHVIKTIYILFMTDKISTS